MNFIFLRNVFRLNEFIFHYGYFLQNGNINENKVMCNVDMKRRLNLSRNHTTTHLVNKILRELLNDSNLIQKASLIHEDHFIFEYSSINIEKSNTIFDELERRVNFKYEKIVFFITVKLPIYGHSSDFFKSPI